MGNPVEYRATEKNKRYVFSGIPKDELCEARYLMRFAGNLEDIDAALKLRFEVFNLELGEGLDSSYATRRDEDEFDPQCHHLIVIEKKSKRVIATYRMQTRQMAEAGKGFYSQGEFDFSHIPSEVLDQSVEVGRACIVKEHRNGRVLFLLWKGIAKYMQYTQKRYLFGCCSLTSQDRDEGKAVMDYLERNGHTHRNITVPPLPEVECYPPDSTVSRRIKVRIPILFRLYLNYSAKVCGPPAIDRAFKTIDYFVMMDLDELDKRTRKMFF